MRFLVHLISNTPRISWHVNCMCKRLKPGPFSSSLGLGTRQLGSDQLSWHKSWVRPAMDNTCQQLLPKISAATLTELVPFETVPLFSFSPSLSSPLSLLPSLRSQTQPTTVQIAFRAKDRFRKEKLLTLQTAGQKNMTRYGIWRGTKRRKYKNLVCTVGIMNHINRFSTMSWSWYSSELKSVVMVWKCSKRRSNFLL